MKIQLRVPATCANLGPGFDTLGLALKLYNYLEIDTNTEQLSFDLSGEGASILPRDQSNLVYQAMTRVFIERDRKLPPLKIKQINKIPIAAGLGSSAAAIIGGVFAANQLLADPLSQDELLKIATEMEGHPDNVAPALFGGLMVSAVQGNKVIYYQINPVNPPDIIGVIPDFSLQTEASRQALPEEVPFKDAVDNLNRIAFLLHAFSSGDYANLQFGCEDYLHQPYRSKLIPGLNEAINSCYKNGGLGAHLSGAGPTIIAYTNQNHVKIKNAMEQSFSEYKIGTRAIQTSISYSGVSLTSFEAI